MSVMCKSSQTYFEEIAFLSFSLILVIIHLFLLSGSISVYKAVGPVHLGKNSERLV